MSTTSTIMKYLLGCTVAVHALNVQTPLIHHKSDLIDELVTAEIIPTVLDDFKPLVTVKVSWDKAETEIGNTIKPKKMQDMPDVYLIDELPNMVHPWTDGNKTPQLTLALTDPDAPSRDNPEWAEVCHWIATDIPLSDKTELKSSDQIHEIMPYKPPGPPPKTGKHRYVFVALMPANGTTDRLHLSKPTERHRWGYETQRRGLREWAVENGLAVVGANFVYSQNKKQ